MRFDIDGDEFVVDLLLFHVTQLRYTVIELKIGKFKAEYAGQLGFYIAMIDDELRRPEIHAPTVGILVCADRNERVVRYALRAAAAPMAVATYTYDKLPAAEKDALPNLSDQIVPDSSTIHTRTRPGELAYCPSKHWSAPRGVLF